MNSAINWADKRAQWNLQPKYWETEIGAKRLKTALIVIGISAVVFGTIAAAAFSAGILAGSALIAIISTVTHYSLAQTEDYWKDPNYCQKRSEEALNLILDFPLMGMRKQTIDKVKVKFQVLLERNILCDDDFEQIRKKLIIQYLEQSWTSFEAFQEASGFSSIAEVPEEACPLLKQKCLNNHKDFFRE